MKDNKTNSTRGPARKALTRRDVLKLGLAATGTLALPILVGCGPAVIQRPPITSTPDDNFPQPKTINSVNGVLETTLLIKMQSPPSYFKTPVPATPTPDPSPYPPLRMYGSPIKGPTAVPTDDTQWDWSFPGPTLRVNPGDRIKLTLLNYLPVLPKETIGVCEPQYYPTPGPTPATTPAAGTPTLTPAPAFNHDKFPDCFSENNVTNLHYHGLHVPQGPGGDDVLLAIYPFGQNESDTYHGEDMGRTVEIGESSYDFQIPRDHPRGTFWYHPHKHGSTDLQVANGMAGALIVNDTLNEEPEFRDRPPVEQVLVIQAILPDLNFPNPAQQFVNGMLTVNGVTNPTITMKAGEVQRWRLINATGAAASAFELTLAGEGRPDDNAPEMYIIAVDGNFLNQSHWDSDTPTRAVFLAPGNRADVLVYAPAGGQFTARVRRTINNQRNTAVTATSAAPSTPTALPAEIAFPFAPLLTVNVEGQMTPPMTLPARLPPLPHHLRPFQPGEADACARNLTFELLGGSGGGAKQGTAPRWAINGQQFDPGRVDQCMLLGTSETWTLINTTPVAHPFHIHLNPFLIEQFSDPAPNDPQNPMTTGDNPVGQWQDTIIIPGATFDKKTGQIMEPGIVVIRHRFVDFTGKFVLHCHILGHEDRGMMQLLEVVKDAKDCTAGGGCPTDT